MRAVVLMRHAALALMLCALAQPASGQTSQSHRITGTITDAADSTALPGVNVVIMQRADTTRFWAGVTNVSGAFDVSVPAPGDYRLRASFVGYKTLESPLRIVGPITNLDTLSLQADVLGLGEIVVEDVQERFRMRGDTTVFNADAFKVNRDASAQDLVAKMPGVVVQDGQVQAQGEQVQRVTVDGREFFGSDPTVALRNLPAEIIQSVEVFDRQSDQAQFTGFNDGNTQKTINIVTRTGMNNGQFGKVYGGYGADERYITGGNINIFDGDRRISIIGLANNVNQQNFAFEDLLGMMGGGGGFGGGGGRGGMMRMGGGPPRGGGGGGNFRFGGGGGGGGFNPGDFLVGQQGGLNSTVAVGLNYSEDWGEKAEFSGSYFFNRMANSNEALLDRQLFLPDSPTQFYTETTTTTSTNYNHRLNARLEYEFDESNSLMVRPRVSFQDNNARNLLFGANSMSEGDLLNRTTNDYRSDNAGFTSSTDILFRHRFPKQGRTISANAEVGLNDRWGDTDQLAETIFFDLTEEQADSLYDQEISSEAAGQQFGIDLDY
ncbi:MAG TPA: TonB-dependent receptor, partial [Rhodothermales bacterium]